MNTAAGPAAAVVELLSTATEIAGVAVEALVAVEIVLYPWRQRLRQ